MIIRASCLVMHMNVKKKEPVNMKRILPALAIAVFCLTGSRAADYYINGNQGSNTTGDGSQAKPWKSITHALTQLAPSADIQTIHVAAAVYNAALEQFPIMIKNGISIIGAGRDVTILDAQGTSTVIVCENVTDSRTRIEGFTITGGRIPAGQGAILIQAGGINLQASSLAIVNNRIIQNVGSPRMAAGIACLNGSSPLIESNIIADNTGEDGNSVHGIETSGINSKPIIRDNDIEGHRESGIQCSSGSSPIIQRNVIRNNEYGINCKSSTPSIQNNEITENNIGIESGYVNAKIERNTIAHNKGDGIFLSKVDMGFGPGPDVLNNTIDSNGSNGINLQGIYGAVDISSVKNNIISNNTGYGLGETIPSYKTEFKNVQFNLFYNNIKGHYLDDGTQAYSSVSAMDAQIKECHSNIEGAPMFVDATNHDYHLKLGSPAINAGDPNSPLDDDGSRADIGAYPRFDWSGPPSTPKNPRAIPGHAQVAIFWNPNPDEDLAYYTIFQSQINGFSPSPNNSVANVNVPDTTYITKNLRNGSTYYYRICAVDSTGKKSDYTAQFAATPVFNPDYLLLTSPSNGIFVNQTPVVVKGIAVMQYIKKVEINGIQAAIINDAYERSVNLNEGANQIRIVGYDEFNVAVKEIGLTIKLDSNPPLVGITNPGNGQSFNYSPIKIQGTVTDNNLVSVEINGIKAKCSGNTFILGENQDTGLDVDEGWKWIKAVARDSSGNTSKDSVQVNCLPPIPKNLYLKSDKLSWFPFPPYPSNTTEGYSTSVIIGENTWKFPLNGDIQGSTYNFSLLSGCLGLGSATMIADLVLKHGSEETLLASTPSFTSSMAGWTPLGYLGPSRKEFTVEGIDPVSSFGDTLILKVRKTSGDRAGLIFIHELDDGNSWIKIPFIVTNIEDPKGKDLLPAEYKLYQNYPNPFNPETTIQYQIIEGSKVKIEIYSVTGKLIKTLIDENKIPGFHSVTWDGRDHDGAIVTSGLYICTMNADAFYTSRKLILVR
jgi:hypothetical protein